MRTFISQAEHKIFGIASISKTFTATVLADLANQGLLSLDDKLEKYVGFPVALNGTAVRLIDLATHTSGLPNEPSGWKGSQGGLRATCTDNILLDLLKTEILVTEPGKVHDYSNFGIAVLGYVIEQVTKKSYEEAVRESILNKIGMENTAVTLTEAQEKMRAVPHAIKGVTVDRYIYNHAWAATGGLNSSAYDMTRYIMVNLNQISTSDGQLEKAIESAQKINFTTNENGTVFNRGLVWAYRRVHGSDINDYDIYHLGRNIGYSSAIIISHHLNAGVIVMLNDDTNWRTSYNHINSVSAYGLARQLLNTIRINQ